MKFDSILDNKKKGTIGWTIANGQEADGLFQVYVQNMSLNRGDTLYIRGCAGTSEAIICEMRFLRMGWYQGAGAREVLNEKGIPISPGEIWGKEDKTNEEFVLDGPPWPIIHQLQIPNDWIDGLYVIKVTENTGKSLLAPFYLTTPKEAEGVTVCFSPLNVQARNWWGGASSTKIINGASESVRGLYHRVGKRTLSINRPMFNSRGGDVLRWAYPLIRFIERHELPVSYITDIDIAIRAQIPDAITHITTVGPMRYWTSKFEQKITRFSNTLGKTYAHLGSEAGQHIVRFNSKNGKIHIHGDGCYEQLTNPLTGAKPSGSKPRPPWGHMKFSHSSRRPNSKIEGILGSSWDRSTDERNVIASGKGKHKLFRRRWAQTTHHNMGGEVFNAGVSNWTWALSAIRRSGNVKVNEDVQKTTLEILGYDPILLNPDVDTDMISDDREISDLSLDELENILKNNPEQFDALLESGIKLFDKGNYDIAHPRFVKAHILRPRSVLATYRLARNHHKLKNYEEMVPLYHELLRQRPDTYHYVLQYATLQLALENEDEGLQMMNYAKSIRSEDLSPDLTMAGYYRKGQKFEKASNYLEEVLSLEPNNVRALAEKATLFEAKGEFADAEEIWKKLLSLEPTNERARMGYARSLYRNENYDMAFVKLKQIINDGILRYVRECAIYSLNIAANHLKSGQEIIKLCKELLTKYTRELELGNNGHVPVTHLCLELSKENMLGQALEYLNKYSYLYDNMAEFNLVKAQICQENGEVEKYFQCVKNTFTVEELGNDCFSSTDDEKRLLVNSLTSTNSNTKANGPLVSVVMTVYKDNEMLDSAINSVLEQSHENLELIIVDDSSPDNVMSYLANKAKKDNRIILVRMEKNGGTYLAKNQGMSISKGKYIAFHDSDDWLHPRKIEISISHLEKNPNLVAVFSNYFRVDENGTIFFKGNGAIRPACISLTMRREEVLNALGYFDSVRVSADSEYEYRMKSVFGAERIKYLPTPYLIASVRSESLSQGGRFAVGWSGLSGVRLLYRQSYTAWHQSEQFKEDCMIEKNQSKKRKFPAPKEIY